MSAPLVVLLAHLGFLLLGLIFYNFRSDNGLHRVVMGLELEQKDISRLISYGFGPAVLFSIILQLLARFVAKRSSVLGHWGALVEICRSLWPLSLGLFAYPTILYTVHHEDLFFLLFFSVLGLSAVSAGKRIGDLAWPPAISPEPPDPGAWRRSLWTCSAILVLAVIGYTAWFTHYSMLRYDGMAARLHDAGLYNQLMWNTLQGRPFELGMFRFELISYNTHLYGDHMFAEHIIPTYWIITPLYWLMPSMWTVFLSQSLMQALAAVPLFLVALRKLHSPAIALGFALVLLMHPAMHEANIYDVHVDTFGPFFVLGALAAFLYKRMVLYWVMVVLALGVKEELSVSIAGLGVLLFFGEKARVGGSLTFLAGVGYFFLSTGVLMPYFLGGEPVRQIDRFKYLLFGEYKELESPGTFDVLKSMLAHPAETWEYMTRTTRRYRAVFYLMAPFLLLLLWGRSIWIWMAPILLIPFMSWLPSQHSLGSYYGILPLIPAAAGSVYGLWYFERLHRRRAPETEEQRLSDPLIPRRSRRIWTAALLFAVAMTHYQMSQFPGGGRHRPDTYRPTPRTDLAFDYIRAIPDDAIVSVAAYMGAHLSERRYVYNFPEMGDGTFTPSWVPAEERPDRISDFDRPADYILIDTWASPWPLGDYQDVFQRMVRELVQDPEWGLLKPYEHGYMLFKRGHSRELNEGVLERLDFEPYRRGRDERFHGRPDGRR